MKVDVDDVVRLKAAWEVQVGVIVGKPEHSARWYYTSADAEEDAKHKDDQYYQTLFMRRMAEVQMYASQCQNPQINNWVQMTFVWY